MNTSTGRRAPRTATAQPAACYRVTVHDEDAAA